MFRGLALLCALLAPAVALAESPAVLAWVTQDSGPLPPPDRTAFRSEFFTDGTVQLTACRGYKASGCAVLRIGYDDAVLAPVYEAARASGLLQRPARQASRPPAGDGVTYGWVGLDSGEIELPSYPRKRDARRMAPVLAALLAAVPAKARADVTARVDALVIKE